MNNKNQYDRLIKDEQKRNKYSMHFGKDDFIINGITLNPVHALPENKWEDNQEVDFYMN